MIRQFVIVNFQFISFQHIHKWPELPNPRLFFAIKTIPTCIYLFLLDHQKKQKLSTAKKRTKDVSITLKEINAPSQSKLAS